MRTQIASSGAWSRTVASPGGSPLPNSHPATSCLFHTLYDGDGQRIKKTTTSGTVVYVRDASGQVIAEYSGTGVLLAEYVFVDGQRLCKVIKDAQGVEVGRVYYHADVLGTPVAETSEAGQLVARSQYYPFGEEVVPGSAADPHKFTGKELDSEFGLYYFGARYYDAHLGRFISVDPVGGKSTDPQSWNRYAYALNNPLRYTDPDGREVRVYARALRAPLGLGAVGVHTYAVIEPDNPKDFGGEKRWTLSAYQDNTTSKLVSEKNWEVDRNWTEGKLKGKYLIPTPKGKTDTEFIRQIMDAFNRYKSGSREYAKFPDVDENEGNCNTFTTGLLVGAGVSSDDVKKIDPPGRNPGLGTPLPEMKGRKE